ncbi:MAG: sigma-54-dependent Fis family transcriptional regulator, partial [Rhodoferax sp.]|nr:sigma-54-dependent Fis family transcriptional regulator [Rhodoferax sp.]
EIGDLPLAMQSKLLRAIQERAVRPLGGVSEVAVDARLVSASHKDLTREVREGRFRQDLYYRLNVIRIDVPPLRERLADLPTICRALLERIARDAGVAPAPTVTPDALAHLAGYGFPGNVRELENLLHRALALSNSDRIEARDLGLTDITTAPQQVLAPAHAALLEPPQVADEALPADLQAHLDDVEREILIKALDRHRYNRTAAGASLGLSLRQMRYRMARLGIDGGTTD